MFTSDDPQYVIFVGGFAASDYLLDQVIIMTHFLPGKSSVRFFIHPTKLQSLSPTIEAPEIKPSLRTLLHSILTILYALVSQRSRMGTSAAPLPPRVGGSLKAYLDSLQLGLWRAVPHELVWRDSPEGVLDTCLGIQKLTIVPVKHPNPKGKRVKKAISSYPSHSRGS